MLIKITGEAAKLKRINKNANLCLLNNQQGQNNELRNI